MRVVVYWSLFAFGLLNWSDTRSEGMTVHDFETLLNSAYCDNVYAQSGFSLRVLRRLFPVAKGFEFYDHPLGWIYFRETPEIEPFGDIGVRTGQEAQREGVDVRSQSAMTSIVWGEINKEDNEERLRTGGFEPLNWHGLDLLFRSKVGGLIVSTTTYQVVVMVDGYDDELTITTLDPQIPADIIACAQLTMLVPD